MDDSSHRPGTDGTDAGADRAASAGTPRWVKVFGIVVAVLVLVAVAVMIIGGGGHGPGRHTSSSDREALSTVVTLSDDVVEGDGPSGGRYR